MPIHDWTRVDDGTFHDFHAGWITDIRTALNSGLLPGDYYARAEQVAGTIGPDVLTLQRPGNGNGGAPRPIPPSSSAIATLAPAETSFILEAEINEYTARQRSVVIRHVSNHRVVALIEILSPGNKSAEYAFQSLLIKVAGALYRGLHVLLVDLHPPTSRDPNGIHSAVWEALHAGAFFPPPGRPLTLVSYENGPVKRAHVEPTAVGHKLPDMPLYLEPGFAVGVPLERTYLAALGGLPRFDREQLEAAPG